MDKKISDNNLPGNKAYIKKFLKKSEAQIKKQEHEGEVKRNGKEL